MTSLLDGLDDVEDVPLLSDDELAVLTDDELDAYLDTLEALDRDWVLTPRQALADRLTDECDEVMYGGAAGGGKSEFDLFHANRLSTSIPAHRTLILRSSFPELRRTLIARSILRFAPRHTACGPAMKEAQWKVGDKEWHYGNGSVIEFGYCESEDDVRQYLSAEYECIIIDESTDFTGSMIEMLRTRLRTTRRKAALGCRPHLVLSTNPGGPGHGWHKKRYVEPTGYGQRIAVVPDNPDDPHSGTRKVAFVPSKVDDNRHIDPNYKRNLQALSDPVKRAQYLEGSWDVFEGQFFTEWTQSIHVVPAFVIPKEWPRLRCIDYGFAAPFCCLWLAFDQDGNAYAYRERYGPGHTATEQARMILQASKGETIDFTVADPSVWARTGTGVSIAGQYRAAGLICRKAMNARVDGWTRVRDYLRGSADPTSPTFGPYLRVLEGTCPNLVRTLPELQHDKKKPEDVDTDLEDHAGDTLRYGLMSKPRKAPKLQGTDALGDDRAGADLDRIVRERDRRGHDVLGANV